MKTNHLKFAPALLVALFASSNASALPSYGGNDTNYQQYIVDPGDSTKLIANPSTTPLIPLESLANILAGNAAAPGGNTELCATCDGGFPAAGATTLTVNLTDGNLVLSSLVAADWGSGAGSLLDRYTTDIYTKYGPFYYPSGPLTGQLVTQSAFTTQFVASGGRERSSDPNISYAYQDPNGLVRIGLAGFYDASIINPLFPVGTQISEIVKATWQGKTSYLYSMSATKSNLSTADGSYNGNYEVTIPEPSELALLVAGLTGFLGLRRKAVKA